jgi:hypothetical protein
MTRYSLYSLYIGFVAYTAYDFSTLTSMFMTLSNAGFSPPLSASGSNRCPWPNSNKEGAWIRSAWTRRGCQQICGESCGLYFETITIVIMMIVVTLQIVASLTIIIDDTS